MISSANWKSCIGSYVVAIRSNHSVWLPPGQRVRYTNWRPFERVFSNVDHQTRYIREIIFGQRRRIRFYHLTTDPQTLPPESTWYIMTNLEGKIQKTVDNTYGLCTWIEYGFKHAKNELGWTDYRVTDYASIEHWCETVRSRLSARELAVSTFPDAKRGNFLATSRSRHANRSLFPASLVG